MVEFLEEKVDDLDICVAFPWCTMFLYCLEVAPIF